MDKMNGLSQNVVSENIARIKEMFPNVFTEEKIDFDALRVALGDELEASKERYQFTWNGKSESIKIAQSPSSGTLRPCKEKSKDWDNTENLYIEGALLTMYDIRTNLANQVVKEVKKFFQNKVYKSVIPRNVRVSEAPSYGMPITVYDPKSKGARSYEKFAREFLKLNEL